LPPILSAKDLPGGRTQGFNFHQIGNTNRHLAESDEDSASASIYNTENWLNWNVDLDNPNTSKDDGDADDQSDIVELHNDIKPQECPEHMVVSGARNDPGLTWPTWRSIKQAEKGLMTVTAMETRRNKGNKKR